METNYNNCPFKLTLPIITEDRESYKVSFQMIGKIGINNREFILSEMVVEETYRCKQCKEALTLKKNRAGKCYIGCTKCNHIEYLTPELVNHYIQMKHVTCPEHKQLLTARLGQYGVYIQCSGNGERHYLKADEI